MKLKDIYLTPFDSNYKYITKIKNYNDLYKQNYSNNDMNGIPSHNETEKKKNVTPQIEYITNKLCVDVDKELELYSKKMQISNNKNIEYDSVNIYNKNLPYLKQKIDNPLLCLFCYFDKDINIFNIIKN